MAGGWCSVRLSRLEIKRVPLAMITSKIVEASPYLGIQSILAHVQTINLNLIDFKLLIPHRR
jgi:hypothetical protein